LDLTASTLLNRLLIRGKFRHVQVLLKIAELGSVQRTAEAIGLTQSSVTQALAYIERLLESELFTRHARGVRPTATCLALLPVAHQVMQGIEDWAEVVASRHRRGEGIVRLVASAAALNMLTDALVQFSDRLPSIEVQIREAEGDDQLLAVARQQVDLVACRRPSVIPEGWQFRPLLEDEVVIVCSAEHPLARSRKVDEAALAAQLWVMVPSGTTARERFDEFIARLPALPRTHSLITRNGTLLARLLHQRGALSMLPLSFVRDFIQQGELALVKMRDAQPMLPMGLLHQEPGMSGATTKLFDFLTRTPIDRVSRGRARPRVNRGAWRARLGQ
jgi:DNA-binding transcriptional LysR family regulator